MLISDFVSQKVLEQIKKHKSSETDTYGMIPYLIESKGEYYYYVHYKQSDRYLVIRQSGSIPNLEEITPVIELAAFLVAVDDTIHVQGKKFVGSKTIKVYGRVLKLLNLFESNLLIKLERPRLKEYVNTFKNMAEVIIDRQKKLAYAVEKGERYIENITYQKVNLNDQRKLVDIQDEILRCIYEQNEIQIKTYNDRKEFLKLVKKEMPLFNIRLWLAYLELKSHHQRMYNINKMDREDFEGRRIIENSLSGQPHPEDERVIKSIISKTINPK